MTKTLPALPGIHRHIAVLKVQAAIAAKPILDPNKMLELRTSHNANKNYGLAIDC